MERDKAARLAESPRRRLPDAPLSHRSPQHMLSAADHQGVGAGQPVMPATQHQQQQQAIGEAVDRTPIATSSRVRSSLGDSSIGTASAVGDNINDGHSSEPAPAQEMVVPAERPRGVSFHAGSDLSSSSEIESIGDEQEEEEAEDGNLSTISDGEIGESEFEHSSHSSEHSSDHSFLLAPAPPPRHAAPRLPPAPPLPAPRRRSMPYVDFGASEFNNPPPSRPFHGADNPIYTPVMLSSPRRPMYEPASASNNDPYWQSDSSDDADSDNSWEDYAIMDPTAPGIRFTNRANRSSTISPYSRDAACTHDPVDGHVAISRLTFLSLLGEGYFGQVSVLHVHMQCRYPPRSNRYGRRSCRMAIH